MGQLEVRRKDGTLVPRDLLGVNARAFGCRWVAFFCDGGRGNDIADRTTGAGDVRAPGNDW